MSDPTPDAFVTVAEAARALGVSDKTIRRRIEAGELQTRLDNLPRGGVRRMVLLDSRDGQNERDTSQSSGTGEADTGKHRSALIQSRDGQGERDNRQVAPDTSGTVQALRDQLKREQENADFLRTQIEAQRGQIEQHQRAEAELRAALREALKMSAKALPAGDGASVTESVTNSPHGAAQDAIKQGEMPATVPTSPEPKSEAQTVTESAAPWYPPEKPEGFLQRAKIWLFGG